jgi:hypothetical protein
VFVYVAFAAWSLTMIGLGRQLLRWSSGRL